jgi:hypothetical protein
MVKRGKTKTQTPKPGSIDINGYVIPRYIVHGGPEIAQAKGLKASECQFIMDPVASEEHRKNRDAMLKRWEDAGAEHIYP